MSPAQKHAILKLYPLPLTRSVLIARGVRTATMSALERDGYIVFDGARGRYYFLTRKGIDAAEAIAAAWQTVQA